MPQILLENVTGVVGNDLVEGTSIAITDGLVERVDRGSPAASDAVDCTGLTVLPGFIDIHIHGAVGVDVNAADADAMIEVARFLAANGVTAWTPTLVPDSDEHYARVIAAVDRLIEVQQGEPIAQAVGVHYEGVFANTHMCGALRPQFFKRFTGSELAQLPRLGTGTHMMTFAPEVEGGLDLAAELNRNGWIASIGHTSADVETLHKAFAAGARHMTHFYNAMTGLHHRDVGAVGWALTNPDVTFDIIADGIHVHPEMLAFACRSKSPAKVSLISDSVAPAGMSDGEFDIWGEKVTVQNGRTRNARGSIAGSVITMRDAAVRMLSLGFSVEEVSAMASRNPAKLLGIDSTHGSIAAGRQANIVALDSDGNVDFTIIRGRFAYRAG